MNGRQPIIGILFLLGVINAGFLRGQEPDPVTGLNIPDGFKAVQVAGDELATNVYCLAVSPAGETFVSGPGYIKVLIDTDDDGVFDHARLFANGPGSGAQGICFDGNDLLCTGDQGLLRFVDRDNDGVADGPPELVFPIKCGGEHHAHAIRKGPDGWWYLLAGNQTPIPGDFVLGENSPVLEPRAGFLMRIHPDWSKKEIFAHGFRNAYDFDFNSQGQVFVYDSDGERDISLPWYRPTRLFQIRPGDDAGWVAAGWKRPSSYLDMPVEIGALGRGSPTGVVVGRSSQFPASYQDAIFVADWTFGRVVVFQRGLKTGQYNNGSDFATANGQFGFAVTDLDFDPRGSLLVSVGGRGTRGAIYRITFTGSPKKIPLPRDRYQALATSLRSGRADGSELIGSLDHVSPVVRTAALEMLVGRRDVWRAADADSNLSQRLAKGLRRALSEFDSKRASLVRRIAAELELDVVDQIDVTDMPIESRMILASAKARTIESMSELVVQIAARMADGEGDQTSLCRIAQLLIGGCGAPGAPQMFKGYTARLPLPFSEQQTASITRDLTTALGHGLAAKPVLARREACEELGRLAALLGCRSENLQQSMAVILSAPETSVPQQIHWLNCLAQTANPDGSGFEGNVETRIVQTLTGLGERLERTGCNTDRNFYPRMNTLVKRLIAVDDGTIANRIANTIIGTPDQVYLFESLPESERNIAAGRFAQWVADNPQRTTSAQIRVLASVSGGEYLSLIRRFSDRRDLRKEIVGSLSRSPIHEDRNLYTVGLGDSDLGTIKNSAIGLRRIFDSRRPQELMDALKAAKRLAWDNASVSVRDQLLLLIERHAEQDFRYRKKQPGVDQSQVLADISNWAREQFPNEYKVVFNANPAVAASRVLESVDWRSGDASRGAAIYRNLQCAQCHDAGSRLGPRLEGVTKRFGREDLFRSILSPDDQVPERYRALVVQTEDGQLYRGSVVYESVDGITLQDTDGRTIRLNQADIESRVLSKKSLMPAGLLDEASDQDLADLYEFLKSR